MILMAATNDMAVATGKHRRPICVMYRCRTLAATAQVRVFQATNRHRGRERLFLSTFAKWLPSGRVTPLGDAVEEVRVTALRQVALAGRFVADVTTTSGKE